MHCPEKQELQRKCTAAWQAYAAEAEKRGCQSTSIIELVLSAAHEALRLRGKHLKASRELSRHLAHHRC